MTMGRTQAPAGIAIRMLLLAGLLSSAPISAQARGETLTLHGASIFDATVIQPLGKEIVQATGVDLIVVPNRSDLGLLSLARGEIDLAMISGSLEAQIEFLRRGAPELPYDRLQAHEITQIRVSFAVNEANPVRALPLKTIGQMLEGKIINWKDVGGADLAVRVVAVRPGGGVLSSVERALLEGSQISAPGAIRVLVGPHVVKIIAQEAGALGITQINLLRNETNVRELETDEAIEPALNLVTRGAPSPAAAKLIQALRARFPAKP